MKTAAFSAAELRFGAEYPGPRICRTFTRKGAAVSSQGLPEIRSPLGGRPKAGRAAGSFARRSGKADRPARTSPRRSAKADRPARTSPRRSGKADNAARSFARRSGKADNGGRLCPAWGFFGRATGRNGALPYNARKSQFLRNGDVWATESLFLFAVLWLAFLPDQSETGVAGGGKARRPETPAAPRRPAQRPRPAPGFCAASANTRPGDPPQSACSRRPSGCPQRPNLSARRRAESPKRKGK